MLLPCQPCSQPHRCRSPHQQRSGDGSSGCGPHESHICIKNRCFCIRCSQAQKKNCTQKLFLGNMGHLLTWTKVSRGSNKGRERVRKVLSDEREPGDESYLPLGRSPSSFLQRTVGTGSPRASHLNSTL